MKMLLENDFGIIYNRNFKQGVADKVLLTDIAYLPYGNKQMAYFSTIKDTSTNELLAHNLLNSLEQSISIRGNFSD